MGRKGGGRAGFMKAARHGLEGIEEGQQEQGGPAAKSEGAAASSHGKPDPAQPQPSSKSQKFLKEELAEAADRGDDEPRREGGETRGQVLQRHKREQKALKEQTKRLGKKAKDEAVKLEEEMEKRHAAELAAFDAPRTDTAAAVALAGSLYSVHLDGEEHAQQSKKPTKSQKRKEERARKDAERDARIAAELAELGDTERMLEERELRRQLRPLGLAISEIPPDGHCLYRSLEDQLRQLQAASAAAGAAPATEAALGIGEGAEPGAAAPSFMELRAQAADYMRRHADHFMPFVLEEDTAGAPAEAFEAYCHQLETTAAWGGQPELQALAQALQAHIQVFCAGMPALDVGVEFQGMGRTLRLCYLKHAYGLGEHYNSVQPTPEGDSESDEDREAAEAAAVDEESS